MNILKPEKKKKKKKMKMKKRKFIAKFDKKIS